MDPLHQLLLDPSQVALSKGRGLPMAQLGLLNKGKGLLLAQTERVVLLQGDLPLVEALPRGLEDPLVQ